MVSTKPRIRTAEPADFVEIGAEMHGYDASAYVAELNGRVIGICGLCYSDPAQAFSLFLPEFDNYPKIKVKLMTLAYSLMLPYGKEVYAIASPLYDTSCGLLEHYCFIRIGDHDYGRGVYVWQPPARS